MPHHLTVKAHAVLTDAYDRSRAVGARRVRDDHLLAALLEGPPSVAHEVLVALGTSVARVDDRLRAYTEGRHDERLLAELGIDLDVVRQRVDATFGEGALDRHRARAASPRRIRLSPSARRVFKAALHEATRRGDRFIGTEHVLIALSETASGPVAALLQTEGVTPVAARAALADWYVRRAG